MKIAIISVNVTSKTSAKGKAYQNAEVIFKNLDTGRVENKNITQYNDVFKQVAEAQAGQVYDVVNQKDGDYWNWTSFVRSVGETAPSSGAAAPAAQAAPSRWNGETPEERAAKQVYIVKQSSLSTAAALLSVGAKTPPSARDTIAMAQIFTDWVLDLPGKKDILDQDNDLDVN